MLVCVCLPCRALIRFPLLTVWLYITPSKNSTISDVRLTMSIVVMRMPGCAVFDCCMRRQGVPVVVEFLSDESSPLMRYQISTEILLTVESRRTAAAPFSSIRLVGTVSGLVDKEKAWFPD